MTIHEMHVMILEAIVSLQESTGQQYYISDAQIVERLAVDIGEIRDHLQLMEEEDLVKLSITLGPKYSAMPTARGRILLRELENEHEGAPMEPDGVDSSVPKPLIKLLVTLVEVAQRNQTLSVSCAEQQSPEQFGAIDLEIKDYTSGDTICVRRLGGSPIDELAVWGFVQRRGTSTVFLTPAALQLVREHISAQPIRQIETTVRDYLERARFRKSYPEAYAKWLEADKLLWTKDSQDQPTTIGHLCREAIQEFADALANRCGLTTDLDKAKDRARIRAVLEQQADRLGKTEKPFLDALLGYWYTVSNLVQRQEHGAQREGEPLAWEDSRRIVFQTMLVMYEIDSALTRAANVR